MAKHPQPHPEKKRLILDSLALRCRIYAVEGVMSTLGYGTHEGPLSAALPRQDVGKINDVLNSEVLHALKLGFQGLYLGRNIIQQSGFLNHKRICVLRAQKLCNLQMIRIRCHFQRDQVRNHIFIAVKKETQELGAVTQKM